MKSFVKAIFCTLLVIAACTTNLLAADNAASSNSLSAGSVVAFVSILVFLVVAPAFKGSYNRIQSLRK